MRNGSKKSRRLVERLNSEAGFTLTELLVVGDERMAKSFGNVQMTPTSVLVNKHGEIVKRYVGEPDFVALGQLVDRLLAES